MARHSKNSTTRPFFTYHERRELGYGTQRQRLGTESMRPFDACCLCLKPSSNPVLTHHGYIYCKECILENILNQKKQIKKAKKLYELQLKEQEQEEKLKQMEKQQEELHKFESLVEGIPSASDRHQSQLEQEQQNNGRKGGGFWIPAVAPESTKTNQLQKFDKKIYDPMCHKPIKAKELITLQFRMVQRKDQTSGDSIEYNSRFMCGCCLKTLTNSTKGAHCIVECGHVSCGNCYQSFVQPALKKKKKSQRNKGVETSSSSSDTSSTHADKQMEEQNAAASIPQCLECAQRILRTPIEIQISGTGFTQEGKANEATKYAPSLGFA